MRGAVWCVRCAVLCVRGGEVDSKRTLLVLDW